MSVQTKPGCSTCGHGKKFNARVKLNRKHGYKQVWLGTFKTRERARQACVEYREKYPERCYSDTTLRKWRNARAA